MALTGLPIVAFSTGAPTLPQVGHRKLREQLGPILREVHAKRGAVEVIKDGQREAVVVEHAVFTALVAASKDATALRSSLPLLLAAAVAGVALPSETLTQLGLTLPGDPDALKRFRSTFDVPITHDEDGARLPAVGPLRTEAVDEAEEDELVLLDIDD